MKPQTRQVDLEAGAGPHVRVSPASQPLANAFESQTLRQKVAESRQFAFSVFILLVILNVCSIERQSTNLKIYFAKLLVWNNFSGFANTPPSIMWVLSFHTLCIYVTECHALITLQLAIVP